MAKQAITLKIAGKSYPFQIESGKEEMYRLAEREVNQYLALIKQQNIRNWTDQDYLSMAALKFAIANVGMRQSRELDNEDLRRLEAYDHIQGSGRIREDPEGRWNGRFQDIFRAEQDPQHSRKCITCIQQERRFHIYGMGYASQRFHLYREQRNR